MTATAPLDPNCIHYRTRVYNDDHSDLGQILFVPTREISAVVRTYQTRGPRRRPPTADRAVAWSGRASHVNKTCVVTAH